MIGIGSWLAHVDTMFFKGDISFKILDKNGEYAFEYALPAEIDDVPETKFFDIKEDDDTLNLKAAVDLIPGKDIDASFTFSGDTASGFIKIPYIGKIKIKDIQKTA